MNKQEDSYKKGNDIYVESVLSQEMIIMNPQKSHVTIGPGNGHIDSEYDQVIVIFSAADPCPIEEREPVTFDPNEPLIIAIESKESVDSLISTLEQLRTQIWGLNLGFGNNKN